MGHFLGRPEVDSAFRIQRENLRRNIRKFQVSPDCQGRDSRVVDFHRFPLFSFALPLCNNESIKKQCFSIAHFSVAKGTCFTTDRQQLNMETRDKPLPLYPPCWG